MSDTSPNPSSAPESLDSAILRLLMENLPDRIYFKDLKSRFVRVNHAHAEWLGVADPAEVVGKSDFDFFSPSHADKAFTEEQVIIRTGQPIVGEVQHITRRDGVEAIAAQEGLLVLGWREVPVSEARAVLG